MAMYYEQEIPQYLIGCQWFLTLSYSFAAIITPFTLSKGGYYYWRAWQDYQHTKLPVIDSRPKKRDDDIRALYMKSASISTGAGDFRCSWQSSNLQAADSQSIIPELHKLLNSFNCLILLNINFGYFYLSCLMLLI